MHMLLEQLHSILLGICLGVIDESDDSLVLVPKAIVTTDSAVAFGSFNGVTNGKTASKSNQII